MTSNVGTEFVSHGGTLGFLETAETEEDRQAHDKIYKALKTTFRPEFLNRIDEIIVFSPLSVDQMRDIVSLKMHEVSERLQEHGLDVSLTEAARDWLAEQGFDPVFGARPLLRALQKHVESPLSITLLSGQFVEGDTVIVELDPEKKELVFKKAEMEKAEQEASKV